MSNLYVNGYWHSALDDYLEKGKPFKEWVEKEFARQYGALVELRDSPTGIEIPEFTPSTYHIEHAEEARQELTKLLNFTDEEKLTYGLTLIEEKLTSAKKYRDEKKRSIDLLKTWKDEIYNFAKKVDLYPDLTNMGHDICSQYEKILKENQDFLYEEKEVKNCEKLDPITVYNRAVGSAREDIIYHEEKYREEVVRIAERNKWVKDMRNLLASL